MAAAERWVDRLVQRLLPFGEPVREIEVLPNGMLHAEREVDGRPLRLHLRAEPDGSGLLIANASAAVRLAPEALRLVEFALRREGAEVPDLSGADPQAPVELSRDTLEAWQRLLRRLAEPGAGHPIDRLLDPLAGGGHGPLVAPFEVDMPLPDPERVPAIVERLWAAGIPHLTLQAPPDLGDGSALVRAVERAEDTGMITGVRALAAQLVAGDLLEGIAMAGVDHVTFPVGVAEPSLHDAFFGAGDHASLAVLVEALRELEVCPVAELPLIEATAARLEETLAWIAEAGVMDVEAYAVAAPDDWPAADRSGALPARALPQVAANLAYAAEARGLRFIWAPPQARVTGRSLAEQLREGPRCCGDVALRVEADGSVVPPRGPAIRAGNLLADPWPQIWAVPVFTPLREAAGPTERCRTCPGLAVCDTGCPRDPAAWAWGASGEEGEA